MLNQRIQFGGEGERVLEGIIRVPDEEKKQPIVIICHDFLENMDRDIIADLAIRIADEGIAATFRYNSDVPGRNFGKTIETTLSQKIEDLKRAAAFAKSLPYVEEDRIFLLGHGLGGNACLHAWDEKQKIMGIITIAVRTDMDAMIRSYFNSLEITEWLRTNIFKYGNTEIQSVFYYDLKRYNTLNAVKNIKCPILIIHGTDDKRNPSDDAVRIKVAAKFGVLEVVDGADHYFSDAGDRNYILNVIMNWILRLVGSERIV